VALSSDQLAALIDLRVCELRELAARTAVEYWRTRPTLADRYFPNLRQVADASQRRGVAAAHLRGFVTGATPRDRQPR
jgi:hypothetical protein